MLTMRFERDYQQLLKGLNYTEQAEVNKEQFLEMMNEMGFTKYVNYGALNTNHGRLRQEEEEELDLIWASLRPFNDFAPILRLKAFMYAIMGYKSDWMLNQENFPHESFASGTDKEVIGTLTPVNDGNRLVFTIEEVDKVHVLLWTMNLNRRDFAVETKTAMYEDREEIAREAEAK